MENKTNGRKICVLTSGGDSQGMNAAVRSVVRSAMVGNARDVFGIYQGYQGMVEGNIKRMTWEDVGGILPKGGTILGTARSQAFMTWEGKVNAAKHLISRGITDLIVIGGDGSLRGGLEFQSEWPDYNKELKTPNPWHLNLIGIPGSIDNDLFGTELSIGCITALNHIVWAIDNVQSSARAHHRVFIVEVMGRACGWLALMAAVVTGCPWVMIPEVPMPQDWKSSVVSHIKKGYSIGKHSGIVIVAEGARDVDGNPVDSAQVKAALEAFGMESRVTVLGHIQRGGSPAPWDRIMATTMGAYAVSLALSGKEFAPKLVGTFGDSLVDSSLDDVLKRTKEISIAIKNNKSDLAIELRGLMFKETLDCFNILTQLRDDIPENDVSLPRIGIMHLGAMAPGMNTAVRVATRLLIQFGYNPIGIRNGVEGLLKKEIVNLGWMSVNGWASFGGAQLGTRRFDEKKHLREIDNIIAGMKDLRLQGLIIVGGWDGYSLGVSLSKAFSNGFRIPVVLIPAAISNNLPCTDFSIGNDTALTKIVDSVDNIKRSAVSMSRVFVIEVMGSDGFLATMAGLATGAKKTYIPEEGITLERLHNDIQAIKRSFKVFPNRKACLVINNDRASRVFNTEMLKTIFSEHFRKESKGLTVRTSVIGHMQHGGNPSGLDRIYATCLTSEAVSLIHKHVSQKMTDKIVCVGLRGGNIKATSLGLFEERMHHKCRRPKDQWWRDLKTPISEWAFDLNPSLELSAIHRSFSSSL